MLRTNKLKAALREGRTVSGPLNSVPAPLLLEMLGYAGYDFVVSDTGHIGIDPETLPFCAIPRRPGQLGHRAAQEVNVFLVGDDRGVAFRALRAHVCGFKTALSSPVT